MKVHKKNPSWMVGGIATMLLCTLFFSCNNEDFLENGTDGNACDNICFGISSVNNVQTRGNACNNEGGYQSNRFVLRSDNSADTLCVRAIVSDGINVSSFKNEQTMTRGVPITKTNFYDKFHVLAYWYKKGTLIENQFYINEDATNKSPIWSTAQTYYWPGAEHALQFYAWAPTDGSGLTPPSTPKEKDLKYTVPEDAKTQKDIVVAATESIKGDHNKAVPLTFKHICTAIRFVVGNQMQPGSIKSVALKGVKNAGTYDMASGKWTLDNSTNNFLQTLNKSTTGQETVGTELTISEGTFMMLPQTLPTGATVEVEFTTPYESNRVLSAPIENTVWTMGTTVTYKLSITPEYELEFASQPTVQDAHYVIYPIKIKSDNNLPAGGWTLTSDNPTNVTFVEKGKFVSNDVQALVDAGYWLSDYTGTSTLKSTTTGEVQVYVFLKENATETDRNIKLTLKPTAQGNYETKEFSFTQYCPAWNNGIGVERIQDKDYPWGFNWDSSMKIVYSMPSGFWSGIRHALFAIFGDHRYIESTGTAWGGNWKVTVDFSKVPPLTTATNESDGSSNTWEMYNFDGISDAQTIMNQLESWGGVPDKTLPTNPGEFAARACAMKNKYDIETQKQGDGIVYRPVLRQEDMVWYLPAKDEASNMQDNQYNLSGDYWTSTAITDPGTTAYKYTTPPGSFLEENRNTAIHIRAVRKKN